MITPLSIEFVDSATDEQIILAYVADGCNEADARANLAALRNTDSRLVVD